MEKQKYPEPTVGALILNEEGKVLLVKSFKWEGYYTVPGGHVEVGETMEEAVKREVREEVGLEVEPIEFLRIQQAICPKEFYKEGHFIFLDFLCKTKNSNVKLDGKEIQEYIWVEPEKALKLNLETFTRNLIKKFLEKKEGIEWK